jgi:hypothetical protein
MFDDDLLPGFFPWLVAVPEMRDLAQRGVRAHGDCRHWVVAPVGSVCRVWEQPAKAAETELVLTLATLLQSQIRIPCLYKNE